MELRVDVLVQAAFALADAVLFGIVAREIMKRTPSPEARTANLLFGVWWLSLGLVYLLVAAYDLSAALGFLDLPLTIALIDVLLVLICVALWALMSYLVYLYTGSRNWTVTLAVAYGLLAAAFLYLIAWRDPTGFDTSGFGVQLAYARDAPRFATLTLGLLTSVPIAVAAFAYGTLYFRVKEKSPRYRIAVVSGAFLVWFGWSALSTLLGLPQRYQGSIGLYVINQVIAVLGPLAILMAYRPPSWVRRQLADAPA